MARDDLILLLLDLLGPASRIDPDRLRALSPAAWRRIDHWAHCHWLMPLLAWRHGETAEIPAESRTVWREATQRQAAIALNQRAALQHCFGELDRSGIAAIALKGAWLAWHVYPAPALRPMTDIDLLIEPDAIVAAFDCLQFCGYRVGKPLDVSLTEHMQLEKHLPPLIGPHGVPVELHHRLWEPQGRLDHLTPSQDLPALRRRAITVDGFAYLAPQDALVHLIVHAAHSHRLECGPRVLVDLAMLLGRHAIDWPVFWADAAQDGYAGPARLLLELSAAHVGAAIPPIPEEAGPPPPSAIRAAAPRLLVQDSEAYASSSTLAAALLGGPAGLWQRLRRRRSAAEAAPVMAGASGSGYLGWFGSRLRRTLGDALSPAVWQQSRDLARFSRWIGE